MNRMETDTQIEKVKSYPVQQFLDSLSKTYMRLVTDVRSSKTAHLIHQIEKINEVKEKREQLKLLIMKIEQETGIYTLNVETLLRELLKQDQVSVYVFLDQKVSEQLS